MAEYSVGTWTLREVDRTGPEEEPETTNKVSKHEHLHVKCCCSHPFSNTSQHFLDVNVSF